MEKNETRLTIIHTEIPVVIASDYDALSAQVRELKGERIGANATISQLNQMLQWKEDELRETEYALQCSMNFGAAVNARVTELEQSLATAREEAITECLRTASRVHDESTCAWCNDSGRIVKAIRALKPTTEAGGGEHV
jgi:septal ring factor EnvC (AmiA/AmiB activator)